MGFLEKMGLIEKIPETSEYGAENTFENDGYEEENISAEYSEGCTADTLVEDVYVQNELHDKTHSIFKIEELVNSLPKEMVTETKRASVLSILGSFGLTAGEVVTDGEKRTQILESVKTQLNEDSKNLILSKQSEIEEHKKAIAALEADISTNTDNTKRSNEAIDVEIKRIMGLIDFIGGTE